MAEPVKGRRDRPSKIALTRERTIAAALEIMRAEGMGKVTMRRIAAALDTGAASLYVYVRDTEDLHAQILDALLAPATVTAKGGADWRTRIKTVLEGYMAVLFEHPELARMAMSTVPSGPNYLQLVETLVALLREGGIGDREAAWGIDLLLLYATAHAAEKAAWKASSARSAKQFSSLASAIGTADESRFPNIARLGDELLSGGPARLGWGFDVLLNGVLNTPRPTL